jgi:hypothetical protein
VVITTPPGEEAQADYGSGPMVRDPETGKYRRTRLFVLTLGHSRKSVRFSTHDQQTLPLQMRAMREYAAGRSRFRSKKSVRAQQSVSAARICLPRRGGVRSMWCWSGDWIDGAGRSSIWSLR